MVVNFALLSFCKDSLVIATIFLAIFSELTVSITRSCGNIQLCFSAQNGDIQELSCCMHSPTDCRWISVGRPEANLSFQEESGLILRWQSGRDPFGQYNCLNQLNGTESSVIFLPENEQDSCPLCLSVEACSSSSGINLMISILFTELLLHTPCDLRNNDELVGTIDLNACFRLLRVEISSNMNYSVVCPICDDSQYSIHYSIPRSILDDTVDCSVQGICIEPTSTRMSSSTELLSQSGTLMEVNNTMMTTTSINSSPSIMPSFTPDTDDDEGNEGGIIAGAVVGTIFVFVIIIIIIIIIVIILRKFYCKGETPSDVTRALEPAASATSTVQQPSSTSNSESAEPKSAQALLKVLRPGDKSIMDAIFNIQPLMERHINMDELYAYLNKYGILIKNEREHLGPQCTSKTPIEKSCYFLSALENKTPQELEKFVKALYESSHEYGAHLTLINELQKEGVIIEAITTELFGTAV